MQTLPLIYTHRDTFDELCFFHPSLVIYYGIAGTIVIVACYMQAAFFALAAGRQVKSIRKQFFHSVMRQDISWFDVNDTATLNTCLVE